MIKPNLIDGDVKVVRAALHEIINDLTDEEVYSIGDGLMLGRHHDLGENHVSLLISMSKNIPVKGDAR